MDPEKATRAAARHLHDLYNEFGDWYLAIAAYNCGPGVVEKAVERTGYADFWELRARGVLPAETTNYVPIILAMTIMEKNPAEYGLENTPLDPPLEYDTIRTSAPTSLQLVSEITDTAPAELAEMNPAVLHGVAPADYALHVPKGDGPQLTETLERVPLEYRDSWRAYRVGGGEALASIGRRFGASPTAIMAANKLASDRPTEGDLLLIPVSQVHAAARIGPGSRTASHAIRRPVQRVTVHRRPVTRSRTLANRTRTRGAARTPAASRRAASSAVTVANAESR